MIFLTAFQPRTFCADPPIVTVLHTFTPAGPDDMTPAHHANSDGARPEAPLVQGRDGAFYGTTTEGGLNGTGSIFRIEANTTKFTVLHSFGPLAALFGNETNTDGARPSGALVCGKDGMLYSTATQGGPGGSGTVFKLNPNGSGFAVLHSFEPKGEIFHNTGGASPNGLTLGPDQAIYGVATLGGTGRGLLFKLTTDGKFSVVHSFPDVDHEGNVNSGGSIPSAAVIFGPDQFLYGTTNVGGRYGYGVIYKVDAEGKGFAVLHEFQRNVKNNGAFPEGSLVFGTDGALYGVTRQGGSADRGTVYKINAGSTGFVLLHTFPAPPADRGDGSLACGPLVFGSDGCIYGLSETGGSEGVGTAYKIDPKDTKFFVLHHFNVAEGGYSRAGLTCGMADSLYGVSANGGLNKTGTIFRIALHGAK